MSEVIREDVVTQYLAVDNPSKYSLLNGVEQCGFFGIHGIGLVYVNAYDYLQNISIAERSVKDDGSFRDTYSTHGVVILSNVNAPEIEASEMFRVVDILSATEIMIQVTDDNASYFVSPGGKLPEKKLLEIGKGFLNPPHGKWHIFDFLKQTDKMKTILSKLLEKLKKTYKDVVIHYVINMIPMKTIIYDPDVCELG